MIKHERRVDVGDVLKDLTEIEELGERNTFRLKLKKKLLFIEISMVTAILLMQLRYTSFTYSCEVDICRWF